MRSNGGLETGRLPVGALKSPILHNLHDHDTEPKLNGSESSASHAAQSSQHCLELGSR
jgi:hypothetical protein